MQTKTETKIRNLKKDILLDLVRDIKSIITIIATRGEIESPNLSRIEKSAQGLLKIAEIEGDEEGKRMFSGLLKLSSKDLTKKPKSLEVYLKAIEAYLQKV